MLRDAIWGEETGVARVGFRHSRSGLSLLEISQHSAVQLVWVPSGRRLALVEHGTASRCSAFHAMGRISHLASNDEIVGLLPEHQLIAAGGIRKLRVLRA